jgi:hypothetical protein
MSALVALQGSCAFLHYADNASMQARLQQLLLARD